jgi:hypothetical protein
MKRRAHWYFAESAVTGFRTKQKGACPKGQLSVGAGKMRNWRRRSENVEAQAFCGSEVF